MEVLGNFIVQIILFVQNNDSSCDIRCELSYLKHRSQKCRTITCIASPGFSWKSILYRQWTSQCIQCRCDLSAN